MGTKYEGFVTARLTEEELVNAEICEEPSKEEAN